jgi:hypothetical protein
LAMFGSVLPVIAAQRVNPWSVDIDIVVVPINSSAPIISTRCPISESPAGAKGESGRNESAGDVSGIPPIVWRIFRIRPSTIDNGGIVVRHIDRIEPSVQCR